MVKLIAIAILILCAVDCIYYLGLSHGYKKGQRDAGNGTNNPPKDWEGHPYGDNTRY